MKIKWKLILSVGLALGAANLAATWLTTEKSGQVTTELAYQLAETSARAGAARIQADLDLAMEKSRALSTSFYSCARATKPNASCSIKSLFAPFSTTPLFYWDLDLVGAQCL